MGAKVELSATLSGFLVGLLVGFTGVGGGSLMAPVMILVLGVAPVTAVGTDLWFASITKSVGGLLHKKRGNANLRIVKWLCAGSIPGALVTVVALHNWHPDQISQGMLKEALGAVLVLTAVATFCRPALHSLGEKLRHGSKVPFKKLQVPMTIAAGAMLGVLVTLTSVGAGALCASVLVFLYPVRLKLRQVVGTDIVHAVPLTLVAGIGHLWLGNVDATLLLWLLAGSVPGIVIGSILIHKLDERVIRMSLASILLLTGTRLVFV